MMEIITKYTPFRLKLTRRDPVQLTIDLENKGKESKVLSMELQLSNQLSLDKSGFRSNDTKRFDKLEPGKRKTLYYEIWPKQNTKAGEQPVILNVLEHYNDYSYVAKRYGKNIPLTVED